MSILSICYLIASVTFIIGLKMLSHPATARRGNLIAAGGMALAIFGTIFLYKHEGQLLGNYTWIFTAMILGTISGAFIARKVKMTAMPELVSFFNGMGGACAALISIVEFDYLVREGHTGMTLSQWAHGGLYLAIVAGTVIGTISFVGSMIAWAKLSGKIKDVSFRGQHLLNFLLLALILVGAVYTWFFATENILLFFYATAFLSLLYGISFVQPIGGADMPVVISLLNAFTGVAVASDGFLYDNKAMLTGGILVGAAGTFLTILMCRAMNRSLKNVLIGSFGVPGKKAVSGGDEEAGNIKEISVSDAAMVMAYAKKVIIVPGYGLAVAQAQHSCHELEKLLEEKGVDVEYAIHPVAGRMPGHMNVLLAEADVDYDRLMEMEVANEEFKSADVVLVLGANDVVNPAAKTDPSSPIYGMPVLHVEDAKAVIVNKRTMKPGYAGIENKLFYHPKTSMLFGDAKKMLQQLIAQIKEI